MNPLRRFSFGPGSRGFGAGRLGLLGRDGSLDMLADLDQLTQHAAVAIRVAIDEERTGVEDRGNVSPGWRRTHERLAEIGGKLAGIEWIGEAARDGRTSSSRERISSEKAGRKNGLAIS